MNSPLILIMTAVLYSLVHSLTASLWMKARIALLLGPAFNRWYQLAYNLWAGIAFLPILWLLAVLPDQTLYTIPWPWLLLTTIGQLMGAIIIVIGILQTGALSFLGIRQAFSSRLQTEETSLVTTGLYRWVRHPLYTGGYLLIWFTPMMTINLLTLFTILSIYLVVGAKLEERRLVRAFGDDYRAYRAEVPMLVPRIFPKAS
jgi:protein-S-isoprenylcysteine O-methyltransferase Ste14